MSEIYIQTQPNLSLGEESEIYQLTCTDKLSFGLAGSPTENPVEDRSVIADHYVKRNKEVSFSGIISNIKNLGLNPNLPQRSVQDNVERLETLRDSGRPFTVYFDDNIPSLTNCLFTSLQFSKGSGQGTAYNVNIRIQQISISPQATFVTVKENQAKDINNQHGNRFNTNDSNTKKDEAKNLTILNRLGSSAIDLVTGVTTNGS